MKLIPLFFAIALSTVLNAQFGLRSSYGKSNFEQWQEQAYKNESNKNGNFLNTSFSGSINYWFRLKKRRIEFLPEIGYTTYGKSTVSNVNYESSSIDAAFNVHVYLLDLAEDCDCPTFSKQGNTMKKGFFVHVAPLAKYFTLNANNIGESSTAFGLKGGMGLDIGINDLLTITPMLSYERTTMPSWNDMTALNEPQGVASDISSNYSRLSGDVRLGLRFDGKKKGRRR